MNSKTLLLLIFLVALAGLVALGLRNEPTQASVVEISSEWAMSGHADGTSRSWTYWDGAEPPVVPVACAKCHSLHGYLDHVGEDGTPAGIVDSAAMTGTVLYCNGCHNDSAHALTAVTYPSGVTIDGFGHEATCMQCHQGRTAGANVERAVAGKDEDVPDAQIVFINIHYFAAGASAMGYEAAPGYQYAGLSYAPRFEHTPNYRTCIQCHNPHSLEIDPTDCSPCHSNVASAKDYVGIKQGAADYDGDGDITEGVAMEVKGIQEALYSAIQTYARSIGGKPIGYEPDTHPYFFVDTDGNGSISADEAKAANRYNAYTPRLLKATYNYQAVKKDPGAYAHNPKYVIQLLHDSLKSLSEKVQVSMSGMARP